MSSATGTSPTPASPDVVVLGAGAIGAAAAYELARRGARVALLDRGRPDPNCSHGNAGLICPSHAQALASRAAIRDGIGWLGRRDSPFYIRPRLSVLPWLARFGVAALPSRSADGSAVLRSLAEASLTLHERLAAAGLETGFARRGILSVFESERGFEEERARRSGDGARAEQLLEPGAARELEPALTRQIAGAVYYAGEAHCDPAAFVGAMLAAARQQGAELHAGVEALRLLRSNGRVAELETTAGRMRTGAVVVAAGVWSRELAAQVGAFVPLEAAKGYHVELEASPPPVGRPIYMEEARVIATPLGERLRLAGTLELSGLDMGVDPVRVDALGRAARRVLRLPGNARTVQVWRGLRPCTPDGLPVIGPSDGLDNLYLATGHAMLGMTLAPATGEIVASLVTGEQSSHQIEPFSPARFRRLRDLLGRRPRAPREEQ